MKEWKKTRKPCRVQGSRLGREKNMETTMWGLGFKAQDAEKTLDTGNCCIIARSVT